MPETLAELLAQLGPTVRRAAAAADGVLAIETPAVRRAALVSLLARDFVELTGDGRLGVELLDLYEQAVGWRGRP